MLPKIKTPVVEVTIPSTKKTVKLRHMTVKEEKILLMARVNNEAADFFKAICQIVNNCLVDQKTDVMKLPLFDVEYLFTKVRAASVSDVSKVSFTDQDDGTDYDFEIDLNKVEVAFPKTSNTFKFDDTISFTVKYPPMELYTDKEFFNLDEDGIFDKLITSCVDKVFDGDKVSNAAEEKPEDILEFVNSLPAKVYADLKKFFTDLPSMKHELKYTNKNKKKQTITLKTIEDFFTFG